MGAIASSHHLSRLSPRPLAGSPASDAKGSPSPRATAPGWSPSAVEGALGASHAVRALIEELVSAQTMAEVVEAPRLALCGAHRCGRSIWLVATGAAALCARRPESISRAGIQPRAGSLPRSRWTRCRNSACVAVVASAQPRMDGWASPSSCPTWTAPMSPPCRTSATQNTMAQRAVGANDERTVALRGILAEVLTMDQPRKYIAAMISGLDVAYDLGGGHPLLGRRMPDLDLVTADGPISVFSLLHSAKPVLLNFGQAGGFDIAPWAERVQLVDASYAGIWELPVVGEATAPSAVRARP